jgi:hypothetical protein
LKRFSLGRRVAAVLAVRDPGGHPRRDGRPDLGLPVLDEIFNLNEQLEACDDT